MKTNVIVSLMLLSSLSAFGQSPVSEAQAKLTQEKHEALVQKAHDYLKEKEDLQARLSVVNSKLAKLEEGEDPDTKSEIGDTTYSISWGYTSPTTYCVDIGNNSIICH